MMIKKEDRKTVLMLCDDIRMHSGIATMAREIVFGTVQHYNWINLGAAIKHPEEGKAIDLSQSVAEATGVEDAEVKLYPNSGYGDAQKLRQLLAIHKVDAIFIFTDPRYWTWLFDIEREIRQHTPLVYLNIWDNYPAPLYNRGYYESCDLLMGISKQTVNINKLVLGEKAKDKKIKYVPHGINQKDFYKITADTEKIKGDYDKYLEFREDIFESKKDIEFVVFFNSRNIRRKSAPDLIAAFRVFCDSIGKEAAKKCALVLHTAPVDTNGTDLRKVKEAMCDPSYVNVYFSGQKLSTQQMNWMYNLADLTVLPSSNEGWGLSLTESMMAETMIAANVTGGMQDQMRFVDENGEWYTPSSDVPSNHRGTYKEHGEWALPIFPSNISLVGSVPTPYIFDDRCSFEDIASAIEEAYKLTPEERTKKGKLAREWVTSKEAKMSASNMSLNVIDAIDETIESFKPRSKFDIIKVEKLKRDYVEHKLLY
jgi:glycosyltransferase involved in cell wall biosynthesis